MKQEKLLSEAGKEYGSNIIGQYAEKLVRDVDKKYSKRTLFRIKQFYNVFNNTKVSPLGTQLTWSHYRALLSIKDVNKINYYIRISINYNLSKRDLEYRIKSNEYERLDHKIRNKIINQKQINIKENVPNPIFIRNKNNVELISEKVLKSLIMEDISSFLKELGEGYAFIDSEYKIKIGNSYHKIDILLFNIKYNCYVVIELKVTKFKVEYISQVQKYMNYIDKNIKRINNNSTIGIIICKKEDGFVIEYCSDKRIIIRKYKII